MLQKPLANGSRRRAELLQNRLINFGAACCATFRGQYRDLARSHIAKQLIRSATAPTANYAEACSAESRRDFVHKLRVCLKELRETHAWLRMAARISGERAGDSALLKECDELIAILVVSIRTARRNANL